MAGPEIKVHPLEALLMRKTKVGKVGRKVSCARLQRSILSNHAVSSYCSNRRPRLVVMGLPGSAGVTVELAVVKEVTRTLEARSRFLDEMTRESKKRKVKKQETARQLHRARRQLCGSFQDIGEIHPHGVTESGWRDITWAGLLVSMIGPLIQGEYAFR